MNSLISNQIEQAVNRLDIHKIRMVMEFLDWQWTGIGVPTQSQIYEHTFELLEIAYNSCEGYIPSVFSGGGIKATCTLSPGKEEGHDNYYLFEAEFILTSSDSEG